ncbi:3996_t:CDS:1, partial [Acaulospora colombiana]
NKFISESVGQRSPPPIKPPSPLRYRSPEQRRFLEDKPELKPISPLEPIDETPFGPSPRRSRNWSQVTNQAPAVARSTAMPTLNQEDDEDVDDTDPFFPTTPQPKVHALPRAGLGPSPLSSRTNLTIHSTSHSNSSLASFTPISTSEISRARNAPVMNKAGTLTPNHLQSPEGLKQSSGPASIYSTRSASIRSNDDASVESFDSAEYGPSPRQRELVRRNDSKSPPSASRSKQIPAMNAPAPSWPPHPLPLAEPTKQSSSKSRSAKDSKRNQDKFEYETWLDLSGDEKKSKHSANRDGSSKKRLWPFGK